MALMFSDILSGDVRPCAVQSIRIPECKPLTAKTANREVVCSFNI